MTNYVRLFLLLFSIAAFSQAPISTSLVNKTKLENKTIVGLENATTFFYLNNNTLHKNTNGNVIKYSNLQLGDISNVDTFNPLKINIFYKDLNSVIVLDNRLAEIVKIDFNSVQNYKNVSKVSTGPDNTLWLFNQDLQQLELYDYKNNTTRAITRPINDTPIDLKSNYNYCFLLAKNHIYIYNYFGSLVNKYPNTGYTSIKEHNDHLILKKEHTLFYLNNLNKSTSTILTPPFLIDAFFVTNKSLYIYDNNNLQEFHLKIK